MPKIIKSYKLEQTIEQEANKNECYDLAENLINDVRGTETRTEFIKNTLQGNFNEEILQNIINIEDNGDIEKNLKKFFALAKNLDPDKLKSMYNNLFAFDEYPESIDDRKRFTRKKLVAELTDEE